MNHFEDELRQVLQRKQPPAGFAEKVIAKQAKPKTAWRWLAIGLAASLACAGTFEFHRYQQGMHAKQQLMLAIEITSNKMSAAQQKVVELNQRSILQ